MSNNASTKLSPVLYIPHGGGPLPLLGDPAHASLTDFLRELPLRFQSPSAIVLISAHWEEARPTLTSGSHPGLIYDYYGFPEESYQIQYPASGEPQLAKKIHGLLEASEIDTALDETRGFDHGMFVPLKLMFPDADIPCIQLSLCSNLDPAKHIAIGRALSPLRHDNVLVIGSGLSFHNMNVFFSPGVESRDKSIKFVEWLVETCADAQLSSAQRIQRLLDWSNAPSARFCHPREEHLLPLHVCYGIAAQNSPTAEVVFNQDVLGYRVTGLLWQ